MPTSTSHVHSKTMQTITIFTKSSHFWRFSLIIPDVMSFPCRCFFLRCLFATTDGRVQYDHVAIQGWCLQLRQEKPPRNKEGRYGGPWWVGPSMFHKETPVPRVIPSRELTYPTFGKGKPSSKVPFWGDILVPWRVAAKMIMKLESQVNPYSKTSRWL